MKKIWLIPYRTVSGMYELARRSFEYVFDWATEEPSIPSNMHEKLSTQGQKNTTPKPKEDLEHRL